MTRLYHIHKYRIRIISLLFLIINISILSRMLFIQSFKAAELRSNMHKIGITSRSVQGDRGHIYDRNGEVLAETINKYTFWANTKDNIEKEEHRLRLIEDELKQKDIDTHIGAES